MRWPEPAVAAIHAAMRRPQPMWRPQFTEWPQRMGLPQLMGCPWPMGWSPPMRWRQPLGWRQSMRRPKPRQWPQPGGRPRSGFHRRGRSKVPLRDGVLFNFGGCWAPWCRHEMRQLAKSRMCRELACLHLLTAESSMHDTVQAQWPAVAPSAHRALLILRPRSSRAASVSERPKSMLGSAEPTSGAPERHIARSSAAEDHSRPTEAARIVPVVRHQLRTECLQKERPSGHIWRIASSCTATCSATVGLCQRWWAGVTPSICAKLGWRIARAPTKSGAPQFTRFIPWPCGGANTTWDTLLSPLSA